MSLSDTAYKRYTSGTTWRKTKTGVRYRDGLQKLHAGCPKNDRWRCTYCYPNGPSRHVQVRKAIADADYDPVCDCCCIEFDPVLGSYTTETEKRE